MRLLKRLWRSYKRGWLLLVAVPLLASCSYVNFTGPHPGGATIGQIKVAKP